MSQSDTVIVAVMLGMVLAFTAYAILSGKSGQGVNHHWDYPDRRRTDDKREG